MLFELLFEMLPEPDNSISLITMVYSKNDIVIAILTWVVKE